MSLGLGLPSTSMFVTPSFAFVVSTSLVTRLALLGYVLSYSFLNQFANIAQESFNSRLKAEGDEESTNLYVSNLPKNMTESVRIFLPSHFALKLTMCRSLVLSLWTILSVLAEFYVIARTTVVESDLLGKFILQQVLPFHLTLSSFETRDVCEEIIKKFHGQPIGDEGLLLQVRYADTQAQKDLKRITTERRQFRTNEYNVGAYGGSAAEILALSPPLSSASPLVPRASQIGRHFTTSSRASGSWKRDQSDQG